MLARALTVPPRDRDPVFMYGGRLCGTFYVMSITARRTAAGVGSRVPTPRRDALHDIRVITPGIVPIGVFLGVTLAAFGEHPLGALTGAAVVYAGSAQLATATSVHSGAGVAAAVAAGAVVSARLVLYGAALEDRFRRQPAWFRWLGPAFIVDQTFVSAVARPEHRGSEFRRYWVAMGVSLLVVWLASVGSGLALAPLLPDLPHLVLVGSAMFLAMLVRRLVDRPSVAAAVVGSATAAVACVVTPTAAVLAGTLAGVLAAVGTRRRDRS
jgi:predicted branched-subunit amino acid permease